jgi:hypothetical protein
VKVRGLAIKSLVNAVLADLGREPIQEVREVSPQSHSTGTVGHGFRFDVKASTTNDDLVFLEVRISSLISDNL